MDSFKLTTMEVAEMRVVVLSSVIRDGRMFSLLIPMVDNHLSLQVGFTDPFLSHIVTIAIF